MADALKDKWDKAFHGHRALTTQSYTETNTKNGFQYEASWYNATVAAGASFDVEFNTGAKPVIIKNQQIAFTGVGVTINVYEAPTTSGGTAGTVYNLNRIKSAATTVSHKIAPTVSAPGTQIGATAYGLGGTGVGQTIVSPFAAPDMGRVLKPSTKYLLRITNNDAAAQKIAAYLTWYEGTPDLPEA